MSDVTINGLGVTLTSPDSADLIGVWDVSAGQYAKCTKVNLVGANINGGGAISIGASASLAVTGSCAIQGSISGGGVIATGGFTLTVGTNSTVTGNITGGGEVETLGHTLTVPATGTAALLGVSNVFVKDLNVTPNATNVAGLNINMPASNAAYGISMSYNSGYRGSWYTQSGANVIDLASADLGSGVAGPSIAIGRNSNATNTAGTLQLMAKSGTNCWYWTESSGGNLRASTSAAPGNANDNSLGVYVGTETSSLDTKDVIDEFIDYDEALALILAAPLYRFTYKNGKYQGQEFTGVITDYSPTFGADIDEEHPHGKSLNVITAHGYEMAAIKALYQMIMELQPAKVAA